MFSQTKTGTSSVIDAIENDLSSEINLETLAKRHFISLRQLHRDFYSLTGHSVGEYIRLRRISNACAKIKASTLSLDVIAGESGYETQQAFHKQFKNVVGLTPLAYKKSDCYFCFYPMTKEETPVVVRVGEEKIPPLDVTRYYDTQLIGIEDRALASLGSKTRCINEWTDKDKVNVLRKDDQPNEGLIDRNIKLNGRIFGRHGKQNGSRFCYEVLMSCQGEGRSVLCATTTVPYIEETINNAWNYLYNSWLPGSMFEQADEGYFEEYFFHREKNLGDRTTHKIKLYLPIVKRRDAQHIVISERKESSYIIAKECGEDAERRASERVLLFLRKHYPLLLHNARQFYVQEEGGLYACGVACPSGLLLPQGSCLEMKILPAGRYAVLSGGCLGDTVVGEVKMRAWLKNNSISYTDEPMFAIYESQNGRLDEESVTMTLMQLMDNYEN
jgi:AraC-like DNA-binding protein/DNA gyrase inhibitor GyrI